MPIRYLVDDEKSTKVTYPQRERRLSSRQGRPPVLERMGCGCKGRQIMVSVPDDDIDVTIKFTKTVKEL